MISKLKDSGLFFYVLCVVNFYVVPLFSNSVGSDIIIFMVVMPLVLFISSVFYGYKMGLNWHYSVGVAVLFIPNLFTQSFSTWVFLVALTAIAYMGDLLGNEIGNELEVKEQQQ